MKKYTFILLSIILVVSSCLPKGKLLSEQQKVKHLQTDSIDTHTKLTNCNLKVANLEEEKEEVQKALSSLSSS